MDQEIIKPNRRLKKYFNNAKFGTKNIKNAIFNFKWSNAFELFRILFIILLILLVSIVIKSKYYNQ